MHKINKNHFKIKILIMSLLLFSFVFSSCNFLSVLDVNIILIPGHNVVGTEQRITISITQFSEDLVDGKVNVNYINNICALDKNFEHKSPSTFTKFDIFADYNGLKEPKEVLSPGTYVYYVCGVADE